jgi:hypothetical protein
MSVGTFAAAMAMPPPLNFGLAAGRASGACERRAAEIHATAHKERGEHFQRVNNTHTIQSPAYHFVSVYIGTRIRL